MRLKGNFGSLSKSSACVKLVSAAGVHCRSPDQNREYTKNLKPDEKHIMVTLEVFDAKKKII